MHLPQSKLVPESYSAIMSNYLKTRKLKVVSTINNSSYCTRNSINFEDLELSFSNILGGL